MGVVLQDTQDAWSDIWNELKDEVAEGIVILPEAEKGFKPKCVWPEFLEKVWLIKHHLDYARRFSEGGRVMVRCGGQGPPASTAKR